MHDCQLAHSTQDTSCCILLQVGSDSDGPAICSKSVRWCLFIRLQGYIKVNDSWYFGFDRYKMEILWQKGRLVMFVSTHSWDLTWNIRKRSCHNVRLLLLFQPKWRSKRRFCFVWVEQTYEPSHKRLCLPPCGPYHATSNISPNNKVNTRYNGQYSGKELFSTSGGQIRLIYEEVHALMASSESRREQLGGRRVRALGALHSSQQRKDKKRTF